VKRGVNSKMDMPGVWMTASSNLSLGEKDVHVWRSNLDLPTARLQVLEQLLSREEKMKAERFYRDRDRRRYAAAHGILKSIIALYLGMEASWVRFQYGRNGKPVLVNEFANTGICFNISHSEGIALFALSRGRQIGVDIETVREIPEISQIASHFFSTRENEALNRIPKGKRLQAFFRCWTVKEAFIKAIGEGLRFPLDSFSVSIDPDEPAELFEVGGDTNEASRWAVETLLPEYGASGAVVVRGKKLRVRRIEWPSESEW
jgi:4'-phosphopantetheinyl transferase